MWFSQLEFRNRLETVAFDRTDWMRKMPAATQPTDRTEKKSVLLNGTISFHTDDGI